MSFFSLGAARRYALPWAIAAAISLCGLDLAATADGCDTLTGRVKCNPDRRGESLTPSGRDLPARRVDDRWTIQSRPFQSLGGELSNAERPATLGAITFGGDGRRCSGLFRSRPC